MTDNLPSQIPEPVEIVDSGEVLEAEVVGLEPPPPPLWRRLIARAVLSLILGGAGLVAIVIGLVLTITIVGAPMGIPLVIIGVVLCVAALLLPFSRGLMRFHVLR
ncbi:MAG: hypothetical protein NTX64_02670 [Elusimicrobia bacterium]|nr:hypothetical protein [Elusimicrobiota bacterium]